MSRPEKKNRPEEISVLVCLSGSPSNRKVIRTAARFARGNHRSLAALFVDNGKNRRDEASVKSNMEFAASLGADVVVIPGRDILETVADYALGTGVTDIFIGYSGPSRKNGFGNLAAYRLVHKLPDTDVHIIPDGRVRLKPSRLDNPGSRRLTGRDFLRLGLIMAAATGLSVLIDRSRFSNSNIVTIYILAVLITSVMTAERIYGIMAAVLYILLFNFLFIDPRFSFLVYDPDYVVTYFVSLIAAIITGNVSSRLKQTALQAKINAYQAQVLLDASEQLQRAADSTQIAQITTNRLQELLRRDIVFYPVHEKTADLTGAVGKDESALPQMREAIERAVAFNQRTGWGTRHMSEVPYQFLTVRTGNDIYGVIGVCGDQGQLDRFEESILLSLIGECALSLENEKNRKESEASLIIAENERFRSKLLRSISHDLRTPLTSISGNAANLLGHAKELGQEELDAIYGDIYEDSIWLIDLVENLLAITRLESSVEIHPVAEVVADVLGAAAETARRHKHGHTITLQTDEECLVAMMDVPLIMQVISNLISNAIKHTPPDTEIVIRDFRRGDQVIISVADNGPGISDSDKEKIFDLFYTGEEPKGDSGRSLGLGLNLCRSIVEAHGQTIRVEDNSPKGSVFNFTLALAKGAEDETIPDTDR